MRYDHLTCTTCRQPHCYWCGLVLDLRLRPKDGVSVPAHMPTRDHVPHRGAPGVRIVLACYGCNQTRDRDTSWRPYHARSRDRKIGWAFLAGLLVGLLVASRAVRRGRYPL